MLWEKKMRKLNETTHARTHTSKQPNDANK